MSAPVTVYLVRHASNDWLSAGIAGWTSGVHLNGKGQLEARRLADFLAQTPFDRIYTSPLERARQTAEPLAAQLRLQPIVTEAVGEVQFGDWTGKRFAELTTDAQWRQWNQVRSSTRAPRGESMLEVQVRFTGFLHRVQEELPGKTVAVFSHGDPIRAALLFYLGMPLDYVHRIEIDPAAVSVVRVGNEPQVLGVNWRVPAAS